MTLVNSLTTSLGDLLGLNTNNGIVPEQGFDVNNFMSQTINQTGLMKNNLFLVRFNLPTRFINGDKLTMFCEAAALPGVVLATDESIRRHGVGPTERRPFLASFPAINLSFIGDGRGAILKFFHAWINSIVNFDTRKGMLSRSQFTGALPYEVAYLDDYKADIDVIVFDEASNRIIEVRLLNAFPRAVPEIGLAWAITDDFMRVPVMFEYRDWYSNYYDIADIQNSSIDGLNFIQKLILGGTIYQTISTIQKPQSIGDILNITQNASIIAQSLPDLF